MNLARRFFDTGFLAEKSYDGELMIIAKLFPLAGGSLFNESDNSTISDTYATAGRTRCTTKVTTCKANTRLDIDFFVETRSKLWELQRASNVVKWN
jgi:hypothetical protein